MNPDLKKWLSVLLSTFISGGITFAIPALQSGALPTTTNGIESFAVGFLIAGLVAIVHLVQTPPVLGPVAAVKLALKRGQS